MTKVTGPNFLRLLPPQNGIGLKESETINIDLDSDKFQLENGCEHSPHSSRSPIARYHGHIALTTAIMSRGGPMRSVPHRGTGGSRSPPLTALPMRSDHIAVAGGSRSPPLIGGPIGQYHIR